MNIKFITTLVCAISFHFALSQVDPMSTRMYKTDKYGKVVIDTNYRPPQNLKRIVTKAVESTTLLLDANDVYVHPGNTQLEVHISINKQNPNRLIASANTYIGHASQGYYYSNDGGITWAGNDILENSANPNNPNLNWINGDPSTAIDVNGKTFIETIIYDGEGIGSQNSINGSTNWTQLASAVPNSGVAFQNFDKPMIAIDNEANSPYVNNYYCAWTDFTGGVNNRKVVLNRSINSGGAFTIPITLKNGFGQGTSVQTGPNGEVYVCWADYDFGEVGAKGLGFTKSIDGGSSFSSYSRSFNYIGIRDYSLTPTFNNARMNDFPVMAVDKSSTNKRGRIYVCYPTKENGLANGKSIVEVRYSDNEGSTWSNPVMASLTVANQSFFPWITVDDCDGDVYLVYFSFDTQTNYETNTYVAHSSDGGITWENQKVSDVSHIFAPLNGPAIPQGYISDYIGITAYKGKAYPIWFDDRNGTNQLYCSQVNKGNPEISGPASFCSSALSASYLISGISNTIFWSVAPAQITLTTNGANVNVRSNGYIGTITLTASFVNNCGGAVQITKQIQALPGGIPIVGGMYTNDYDGSQHPLGFYPGITNPACTGYYIRTHIDVPPGASVYWSKVSSSNVVNWTQTGNDINFYLFGANQNAIFKLDVSNACGSDSKQFKWQSSNCSGGGGGCYSYVISPNPANGKIKIIVPNVPAPCGSGKSTIKQPNLKDLWITQINVYDLTGTPVKRIKINNAKQTLIDLEGIINGSYTVEIISSNGYKEKQLVILQK